MIFLASSVDILDMKETPTKLRYALRLIHSLQKERGASASQYAYTTTHPIEPDETDPADQSNANQSENQNAAPMSGIGASLTAAAAEAAAEEEAKLKAAQNNKKKNENLPTNVYFTKALIQARQGTDIAFHMIVKYENGNGCGIENGNGNASNMTGGGMKCTAWADALQRVRNKIDECCLIFTGQKLKCESECSNSASTSTNNSTAEDFYMANSMHGSSIIGPHRVIVMFNILIGNVMDEIVLQVINREISWMKQNYGDHHGQNKHPDRWESSPARMTQNPNHKQFDGNTSGIREGGVNVGASHHSNSLEKHNRHHSQHQLSVLGGSEFDSPEKYDKSRRPSFFARSLPIGAEDISLFDDVGVPIGEPPPTPCINMSARLGGSDLDRCISSSLEINSAHHSSEYDIPIATSIPAAKVDVASIRNMKQKQIQSGGGIGSSLISAHCSSDKSLSTLTMAMKNNPGRDSSPDIQQMLDLLSVLLSFTQLKESTGVERSIVCSLMALSSNHIGDNCDDDDAIMKRTKHSTSKLFNDLVVEEANQRMIVRDLQQQSKVLQPSSLSLLKIIERFMRPSREMESVQDKIKDFDLEGVQNAMKLKDFWKTITAYIDQLHALELLILEEVQLSREMMKFSKERKNVNARIDDEEDDTNKAGRSSTTLSANKNSADGNMLENPAAIAVEVDMGSSSSTIKENDAILGILGSNMDISMNEAVHELSRLPAEEIKQRLISFVQGGGGGTCSSNDRGSATPPESSFSAPNEDENDVGEAVKNPFMKKEPAHNLQEWEIDLYEIEFRQRIGRGVAGTTYLAKWSGQQVAVKVAAITDLGLEGWYTEVHSLKRLHHPNVIRLLGSIYNPSPQTYGLVLEYCNAGDLSKALHRPTPSNFFWKIADDVANGISYLHRKMIMHRDIKPANILLDGDVQGGNFCAKLTDFGVAVMHSGPEEHTAETGTYRWMVSENFIHRLLDGRNGSRNFCFFL